MNRDEISTRVLLMTPTRKDGEITSALLSKAGMTCVVCKELQALAAEVRLGAGVVLVTEEAIITRGIQELMNALDDQPAWSDLPVVILMKSGVTSPSAAKVLHDLRNVTLLERPAPTRSVVSAVQAAIRARKRQYQIRDQIEAIRLAQDERQHLLESERAARQEAERAGRLKDDFLATLSHELRTPLNAIFGWAQIIKMNPADAVTVAEGASVIDRNIRVQTQLIEDLLDVSKIISGKVRLDIQRMDLVDVINAAVESIRPAMTAKEIRLEKVVDAAAVMMNGDSARLQQVFWNLLANAVKFTPAGGSIHVLAVHVDSHLEISVTDTGEGIDPEFLPLLFERFSQADSSITRRHGGLGLGLSIVRNLVEMHGGTISAHSPGLNQGSSFIIRLPHVTVAIEAVKDLKTSELHIRRTVLRDLEKLKGLKILVLDDETDSRELVKRFLMEGDAITALAATASEAFSLLPLFKPDVIISDIGMPIQDGYAFMRGVRGQGLETPAVALTAFARPEDRAQSLDAGYQMHLRKPVDPAELIAAVTTLAGR